MCLIRRSFLKCFIDTVIRLREELIWEGENFCQQITLPINSQFFPVEFLWHDAILHRDVDDLKIHITFKELLKHNFLRKNFFVNSSDKYLIDSWIDENFNQVAFQIKFSSYRCNRAWVTNSTRDFFLKVFSE